MKKNGSREVSNGVRVQRFMCSDCGGTWSLGGDRRKADTAGDDRLRREAARMSLERASVRILARRFGKSKDWVMDAVHSVCAALPGSDWVAKRFSPSWGGVLVVDGKHVRVYEKLASRLLENGHVTDAERRRMHWRVWVCAVDSATGDLPHYGLLEEESKVELVMFFRFLRQEIQYGLKVLVCDGNDDIVSAARVAYGDEFLVQRCVKHYLDGVVRKASEAGLRDDPRLHELLLTFRFVFASRHERHLVERTAILTGTRPRNPTLAALTEHFLERVGELTTFVQYPHLGIPSTSNEGENLFHQAGLRLDSVGRFFHWSYAADYLKSWALLRRLTPFTDCRGGRKSRNGKSPLELAGCDVSGVDPVNPIN